MGTDILNSDLDAIVDTVGEWERLAGEVVLVTGAGGFLGSYLVRTLLRVNDRVLQHDPVRVLAGVRSGAEGAWRLADVADSHGLEFRTLDLAQLLEPDIDGVTYIIHAASNASPRHYGPDPVGTILPNTLGTASLLSAARQTLKGFLFVSSSEIYGGATGEPALHESIPGVMDCADPRACYGEGKRAGEAICVAWFRQHAINTYIARPFHTYGPGLAENDGRVFADFVHNVVRGENILIRGDGRARRAFCYVSDAIAGIFTIFFRGQPGEAYNVANPDGELSVRELAELLVDLQPARGLSVQCNSDQQREGYMPSPTARLLPDITRLSALGWRPMIDVKAGFRRTIESFQ